MSPTMPVPRKRERNPRGQGDALRAEIITATWRLLDEQVRVAALSLSLREVAREVGITAQSIYRHFEDKEQLARAVLTLGYDRAVDAMRAARDDPATGAAADDRLRAQARGFCTFAEANRGVVRLMFGYSVGRLDVRGDGPSDPAPDHPAPDHPAAVLWHRWIDAVRECESAGTRWPAGPEQIARQLWAGLLGGFVLTTNTFAETGPGALHRFADQLVDGLLAARPTAPSSAR